MTVGRKNLHHYDEIEQAIASHFGWKITDEWRSKLSEEISRKALKLSLDEKEYCFKAASSPAELQILADLLTTSETRFFREREQIEALRTKVIPKLIAARSDERTLNIWSAACSTGEEAYTIAMLICEAIPAEEKWKINILATDLSGYSILKATKGQYSTTSLVLIEPQIRQRFFIESAQQGNGQTNGHERLYEVVRELKNMINFRRANLYDQHFWKSLHQQFDLVLCNHLLMHFHPIAVKQTVDGIAKVLKSGGVLTVIKGEGMFINHSTLKADRNLPGTFFVKK
jgi:chemotaxis protein methyltransferase CheR